MFSDNKNLKDFVSDCMNCIIYNQNVFLDYGDAKLVSYPSSVEFSAYFILNRKAPELTSKTLFITTDNENVNLWNSTLARIKRYHTCGKTVYIDVSYFSNMFDNTIAEVLVNYGKDLRCVANMTETNGIRIKILLEHVQ